MSSFSDSIFISLMMLATIDMRSLLYDKFLPLFIMGCHLYAIPQQRKCKTICSDEFIKTTPYIVYYNGKRSLCQGKIIHLNPIKQKQPLKINGYSTFFRIKTPLLLYNKIKYSSIKCF